MAGPDLTAETFARGQFRIPPAGGGPTTPQVSYGNWGFFEDTDYAGIDDSAEIWWDPTVEAEDETGTMGVGVWRRAHGGERFINDDDAPIPNPFADPEDTVTVLTDAPARRPRARLPVAARLTRGRLRGVLVSPARDDHSTSRLPPQPSERTCGGSRSRNSI